MTDYAAHYTQMGLPACMAASTGNACALHPVTCVACACDISYKLPALAARRHFADTVLCLSTAS